MSELSVELRNLALDFAVDLEEISEALCDCY